MLRRWFFTGLVVLVPIVITAYVVIALFQFADGILGKYINSYALLYLGYAIPGLGIIFSILIIVFVGALASFIRLRIFKRLDSFVVKFPLVGKIYGPARRIVNFLFSQKKPSSKKVVLVEYPRKGLYSIGFVTNDSSEEINEKAGRQMLNVYISSSPSPLTGVTIFVPKEEVIFLDISVEQATRIIVSGGMVNPEDVEKKALP